MAKEWRKFKFVTGSEYEGSIIGVSTGAPLCRRARSPQHWSNWSAPRSSNSRPDRNSSSWRSLSEYGFSMVWAMAGPTVAVASCSQGFFESSRPEFPGSSGPVSAASKVWGGSPNDICRWRLSNLLYPWGFLSRSRPLSSGTAAGAAVGPTFWSIQWSFHEERRRCWGPGFRPSTISW